MRARARAGSRIIVSDLRAPDCTSQDPRCLQDTYHDFCVMYVGVDTSGQGTLRARLLDPARHFARTASRRVCPDLVASNLSTFKCMRCADATGRTASLGAL